MEKLDERVSDYNKGFIEGNKHSKPSQLTINYFKKMEDKFDKLDEKVSSLEVNLTEKFGAIKLEIISEISKMKCEIQADCEKKFAPAWVADALKVVIGTTFVIFIGAVASLIIKT